MPKFLKLVLAVIICEGAGLIGSLFTTPSIPYWYATLEKPFFSPPNWVFGPVWITLYLLMGISLYLIWEIKDKKKAKIKENALQFFYIQLGLNVLWSIVFFRGHSPLLGLLVIILLLFFIFLSIKTFAKIKKWASYLLYPYIAWVSFATILNFSIWYLNN